MIQRNKVTYLGGAVPTPSGGGIKSVIAGTNISVDNTDPENPIITNTMKDNSLINALIFG
jgi:hypothetical protein